MTKWKIAAIYGSVFLGAGFASGQELLTYFIGFGHFGFVGLMIAGVLFSLTGWAALKICHQYQLKNYHQFMAHLFGPRLGGVMESLVIVFLFCLFVAMVAGAGATGQEAFGINFTVSAFGAGILVFFVLCFGLSGIVQVNLLLAPFMLFGGIFIGLLSFFSYGHPVFLSGYVGGFAFAWVLSAVVYASYNLVTAVPILAATAGLVKTKTDAMFGGIVGGGIITVLGISMALPLFLYYGDVINLEIPFFYIVSTQGGIIKVLYLGILVAAIITTAACNAFALQEWLGARGITGKVRIAAGISVLGVLLSHVGFSNIVAYVYPAFGFVGLFKILVVLFHGFWYTKGEAKN